MRNINNLDALVTVPTAQYLIEAKCQLEEVVPYILLLTEKVLPNSQWANCREALNFKFVSPK